MNNWWRGAGKRGVRLKQEIQVGTVRGYAGYEMEKAGTWRSDFPFSILSPVLLCCPCFNHLVRWPERRQGQFEVGDVEQSVCPTLGL